MDIREKIRKLLALAGNNPNEAERTEAMRMAETLMERHDLDEDDVVIAGAINAVTETTTQINGSFTWRSLIVQGIAQSYGCRAYRRRTGYRERVMVVVGYNHHIDVVLDVANWLMELVRREAKAAYPKQTAEQNAFMLGAATRIYNRCVDDAARRKRELQHTPETNKNQLMRLNAVDAYYEGLGLRSARRTSGSSGSKGAYENGSAFGNNAGLNRQITTPEYKRLTQRG